MKQVDFDVRVFTLNPGGINGGFTHEGMVAYIKEHYPFKSGWKVESVSDVQMSADGISVLVFLAKYVD
jgi:hypothetical protein